MTGENKNMTIDNLAVLIQREFLDSKKGITGFKKEMHFEFAVVKNELAEVKADVRWMKDNSSELFNKLEKFITLYEDQKTELKSLTNQMKRLEGRIAGLEAKTK